jgi:UDP-N-acetylglucosamine transferase subunit ALG13
MIFATVGTQLSFNRMIATIDSWAAVRAVDIFAQTGATSYHIRNLKHVDFLAPSDFDRYFTEASLVIAHAGIGSILTARLYAKPLIIMPRREELGEHRNNHQVATAKKLQAQNWGNIYIAWDEYELKSLLDKYETITCSEAQMISRYAPAAFIKKLMQIIDE